AGGRGWAAVWLSLFSVGKGPGEAPPAGAGPRAAATATLPRRFWTAIAIFVFFTLSNSSDAFLLLKATDSGVPVWQVPLLWAFFNGVKAAAGVPGGALADRIGRTRAIGFGWVGYAVSYVAFALVSSTASLWAVFALYALFYALTEGAERALVADLVGPEARGRAFGAFHASVGLAALPASLIFGLIWK